jgi:hypothetical protein
VQEVVLFLPSPQDLTAGEKADSARLRRSRRFEGTLTHLHANIHSPMCRIHPDWPSSLLESSPAASAPRFTLHSLLVTTGSQRSFRFWIPVLPRRERAQQPPLNHRCIYPFSQSPPRVVYSTVTRCENSKEGRLTVPALACPHARCRGACPLPSHLLAVDSIARLSSFPPVAVEHTSTLCVHARRGAMQHGTTHARQPKSHSREKRARRAFSPSMLSLSV